MSARCFQIEEIVRLICGEFVVDHDDLMQYEIEDGKALRALACVSKMISGVALPLLWRVQTDLNGLLRVMSRSIWTHKTAPYSQTVTILCGEIGQQDWNRFTFYAKFIRYIHLVIDSNTIPTLDKLLSYSKNPTLFPRLDRISLLLRHEVVTEQLPPHRFIKLFSDVTRNVAIDCQFSTLEMETVWLPHLLNLLSGTCNRVHQLELDLEYTLDVPDNLKEAIQDFLLAHKEIERIYELPSEFMTSTGFKILGQMPNLRRWTFSLPHTLSHPLRDSEQHYFHNLQHLTVFSANKAVIHIVDCIARDPCNLRSICISWLSAFADLTNTHASHLVKSISSFHTLQELTLFFQEVDYMIEEDGNDFHSNQRMIQSSIMPLLKLSNLQTLDLESPSLSFLDDSWLSRIPEAFPLLQSFHLRHDEPTPTSGMTLSGLIPLLKCPKLSNISISLKCLPFALDRLFGVWNRTLKRITLHDDSMDEETWAPIVRCLVMMFPVAQMIRFVPRDHDGEDQHSETTLKINELLQKMLRFGN